MINWIVTSSILIVVVIVLRGLLKGRISLWLQYALWVLVLLRLLIPVNVGSSILSVVNTLEKTTLVQDVESVRDVEKIERKVNGTVVGYRQRRETVSNAGEASAAGSEGEAFIAVPKGKMTEAEFARMERTLTFRQIAVPVWVGGMVLLAVVFAVSNLRFAIRLRRTRRPLAVENSRLPVYLTDEIETPCLFGLFRPAIYVTEEAVTKGTAGDDTVLRHILAHETTHYRHKDHVWAVLRGVCLALHWYNPLVWYGAVLSRNDAELACDEATIKRLGEEERCSYGCTLIGMTSQNSKGMLVMATTMVGSGRNIKERIALIVRKPKTAVYTLLAVVLIAGIAVGITFTGARATDKPAGAGKVQPNGSIDGDMQPEGSAGGNIAGNPAKDFVENPGSQQTYLPEGFFDLSDDYESESRYMDNFSNYALTCCYGIPEDVDLSMLFYNGVGLTVTEEDLAFLESQGEELDWEVVKVPGSTMDEVLQRFFDLTLEETNKIGIEQFYYNPETDVYYLLHNDANGIFVEIEEKYLDEDGNIRVVYRQKNSTDGEKYMVTLAFRENRFIFLSNKRYAAGRWVPYADEREFFTMLGGEGNDLKAWLEANFQGSWSKLYEAYNGEKLQRIASPDDSDSLSTCRDVIFYRADEGETREKAVKIMIEAMIAPRMEPSESRPYTIIRYQIEKQDILWYNISAVKSISLLPCLEVYYSYEGMDLVPMENYVNSAPNLLKDGLMPLMSQGSDGVFIFVLMEKDGVYRLQRAEDMMRLPD